MIFMKINLNDSWITLITFIHKKVKTLSLVLKDAKNYLNYKRMIWVAVVKDGEAKVVKVIMETNDFMEIITKVEIIIVVMMVGYFLLYESMLDSVLWARDKYLVKEGGKMLPDKIHMYVAAVEDGSYKQSKKDFWKDVYDG